MADPVEVLVTELRYEAYGQDPYTAVVEYAGRRERWPIGEEQAVAMAVEWRRQSEGPHVAVAVDSLQTGFRRRAPLRWTLARPSRVLAVV